MHKHQSILGSVFLALGILHVIGIIVLLFIFGLGSAILFIVGTENPDIPEAVKFLPAGLGAFIALIVAITGIPNLIAAYGLLKNRPWGLIVGLIVGILNLPSIPLGTAVGVYAIWVFANFRDVTRKPLVL
jgi:hypothetical protein